MTARVIPPKCKDCGSAVCFPVVTGDVNGHAVYTWLCGSCGYLRANPEAPRIKRGYVKRKHPQKESLFDAPS